MTEDKVITLDPIRALLIITSIYRATNTATTGKKADKELRHLKTSLQVRRSRSEFNITSNRVKKTFYFWYIIKLEKVEYYNIKEAKTLDVNLRQNKFNKVRLSSKPLFQSF